MLEHQTPKILCFSDKNSETENSNDTFKRILRIVMLIELLPKKIDHSVENQIKEMIMSPQNRMQKIETWDLGELSCLYDLGSR